MCMAHIGPSVTPPSMNSYTFNLPTQNPTAHVQTDNSILQMLFDTVNQRLNRCLTWKNISVDVSALCANWREEDR